MSYYFQSMEDNSICPQIPVVPRKQRGYNYITINGGGDRLT